MKRPIGLMLVALFASSALASDRSGTAMIAAGMVLTAPNIKPAREITIDLGDGVAMTLVRIEPGEFLMGVPVDKKMPFSDQTPERRVRISRAYYLGKCEVTVGQFRKFVEQTKHVTNDEKERRSTSWRKPGFPQTDLHPVVFVSWYDAKEFCAWLQKHSKVKELG